MNENEKHVTAEDPQELGALTLDERLLIARLRDKQYSGASAIMGKLINKPDWTYEHRMALTVLARLALDDALAPDVMTRGDGYLERLVDAMAETISASLYTLGGYSSLQDALNDASLAPEQGGAE